MRRGRAVRFRVVRTVLVVAAVALGVLGAVPKVWAPFLPVVLLRSCVNYPPFGSIENETAMVRNFGAVNVGWTNLCFESGGSATVFNANTIFVFMEGSDATANALNTFLTANRWVIENWVFQGGRLLLNAAPS